ncbi:putative ABC transporter permease [Candidatus Pacearchaeota archaeon]|nr:putative ABC transporter permease [Candidatus Pacearchaeota archaeon]
MSMIEIFILFLIGSIIGWILEFLYLNLIEKRNVNPGFLKGPYLPIYGFTILFLYFISVLSINIIYKIFLFIIFPTLIELITGVVFEKYFKIKIWDYHRKFWNYRGIICLQASFYWAILSIFYLFVLHNFVDGYLTIILSSTNYIFFYGAIAGIFLLDEFYALNMAFKIKQIATKMRTKQIDFNKFKKASSIFGNLKDKVKTVIKEKSLHL